MDEDLAPIAVVERETGIAKDTLRVWERRYGFPQPVRSPTGDRLYPAPQVARLRLIKRLLDSGHRPGRLMKADAALLETLAVEPPDAAAAAPGAELDGIVDRVRRHDAPGLRQHLSQLISRQGLQRFVLHTLPALNELVGEAWSRGELEVFEEHLYTEQMQVQLRQAIAALPPAGSHPRVLLTSVPEEQHALGLLMLEALLTLENACCVSLGTQTPLADIAAAVRAHRIDVVALSFSGAFPYRQVGPLLADLRRRLPPSVALWAGGGGIRRASAPQGVCFAHSLEAALALLAGWRTTRQGLLPGDYNRRDERR
jgi:hypothetical protein